MIERSKVQLVVLDRLWKGCVSGHPRRISCITAIRTGCILSDGRADCPLTLPVIGR
jgi:hypothetical protein